MVEGGENGGEVGSGEWNCEVEGGSGEEGGIGEEGWHGEGSELGDGGQWDGWQEVGNGGDGGGEEGKPQEGQDRNALLEKQAQLVP